MATKGLASKKSAASLVMATQSLNGRSRTAHGTQHQSPRCAGIRTRFVAVRNRKRRLRRIFHMHLQLPWASTAMTTRRRMMRTSMTTELTIDNATCGRGESNMPIDTIPFPCLCTRHGLRRRRGDDKEKGEHDEEEYNG